MKFKMIFKRTVRNISLQNYFLIFAIIISWVLVLAIFSSTLKIVSSNNMENFEKTVEDYRQKIINAEKFSEYRSLESFFSEVYFFNSNLEITKKVPEDLKDKEIDINNINFSGNDYYIYSENEDIFMVSRFNNYYVLSKIKMEQLKLNNENVIFSAFNKSGDLIFNGVFQTNSTYNDIDYFTMS
ncbi:MAG: hypothetical protein ACQESN_05720, partial [Thermotogota bacterium]